MCINDYCPVCYHLKCRVPRLMVIVFYKNLRQNIVAHLLKARTVEAEKQPMLINGPYTRSRGCCDARNNRRAVFSVGSSPRLYNEDLKQLELELSRELTVEGD
jgi:hypothetical protein